MNCLGTMLYPLTYQDSIGWNRVPQHLAEISSTCLQNTRKLGHEKMSFASRTSKASCHHFFVEMSIRFIPDPDHTQNTSSTSNVCDIDCPSGPTHLIC